MKSDNALQSKSDAIEKITQCSGKFPKKNSTIEPIDKHSKNMS